MKQIHLLTLILFCIACNTEGQQKTGWVTWSSTDKALTVGHPIDWAETQLNTGEIVSFVSPKDSKDDHYPDMLSIMAFSNTQYKSIDQLKDYAYSSINTSGKFKMTSSEKITAHGKEFIKSIIGDVDGEINLIIYTLVKNDKIYFLILNIEKRNYESFKYIGDEAIKSFTLK